MSFKKELLNIREQTVPMCGKTSCMGKRAVWLNRELKLEHRGEREYIISGKRVRQLGRTIRVSQGHVGRRLKGTKPS